jgi:hypothetical protein
VIRPGQSGERARIAVCGAKEDSNTEFAEKQSRRETVVRFARSALKAFSVANSVRNLAFVPAHRRWAIHPIALPFRRRLRHDSALKDDRIYTSATTVMTTERNAELRWLALRARDAPDHVANVVRH